MIPIGNCWGAGNFQSCTHRWQQFGSCTQQGGDSHQCNLVLGGNGETRRGGNLRQVVLPWQPFPPSLHKILLIADKSKFHPNAPFGRLLRDNCRLQNVRLETASWFASAAAFTSWDRKMWKGRIIAMWTEGIWVDCPPFVSFIRSSFI